MPAKLFTVKVGAIPQGSKIVSGDRLTQAARMPEETAPITSKGLPETSQASEHVAADLLKK